MGGGLDSGYGFAGYYTSLFFLGPTISSLRKPKGLAGVVGSCEYSPIMTSSFVCSRVKGLEQLLMCVPFYSASGSVPWHGNL